MGRRYSSRCCLTGRPATANRAFSSHWRYSEYTKRDPESRALIRKLHSWKRAPQGSAAHVHETLRQDCSSRGAGGGRARALSLSLSGLLRADARDAGDEQPEVVDDH